MDKSKLESLKQQREALNKDYRAVSIEYTKFKDDYIEKLIEISDKIHGVDAEIRAERMPVEEVDI